MLLVFGEMREDGVDFGNSDAAGSAGAEWRRFCRNLLPILLPGVESTAPEQDLRVGAGVFQTGETLRIQPCETS